MSNNWIPISIQNESHVETHMFVTLELIVSVWWVITHHGVVSTSVKSFQHNDILDSTPQRWLTHILSDNHYHLMCICEEIDTQKSLKFTLLHTVAYLTVFIQLLCSQLPPSPSITKTLHTFAPYMFCLSTATIP